MGFGVTMMQQVFPACQSRRKVLARKGSAMAAILINDKATKAETFAATELAMYLSKITGAKFLITNKKTKKDVHIHIQKGEPGLGPQAFRIHTVGNDIMLTGFDDAGVEFAVYTFLEKYLGVRWLWPGELGEVVPFKTFLSVGDIDDMQKPDFVWRNRGPGGAAWGATSGPTELHSRELMMGITKEHQQEVQLWEKRNKWGGWKVYGGHNLSEIFPPAMYASSHPEYYALVKGKRAVPGPDYDNKHEGQICTTEPGVIKTAVEWVNNFYDTHSDYLGVHISMNDGIGFCECARCLSLDSGETMKAEGIDIQEAKGNSPEERVITDRIFTFANQIAEQVQKKHPGKFIFCFAYGPMILPPRKIQLHPQVVPQYTLWSAYMHANSAIRHGHETLAAEWAAKANQVAIYEYHINGSWPGLHRLAMTNYSENIRFLKRKGIQLYQTQSGDEFGTNGLNYYVTGKLLWNTSTKEKEVLNDFYEKGFESAAAPVRRFHERMEKAWTDASKNGKDVTCNSLEDTGLAELFNEQLFIDGIADLDLAERLSSTETIKKRIAFYRQGLYYTRLTVEAVSAAKALGPTPTRQLLTSALKAISRRTEFVEEVKNDFILPYFWIRYNNEHRNFLPSIQHLQELLAKVGP